MGISLTAFKKSGNYFLDIKASFMRIIINPSTIKTKSPQPTNGLKIFSLIKT